MGNMADDIRNAPPSPVHKSPFQKELEHLINKHSMENASDTPDFILADYLVRCLRVFEDATKKRHSWYGKEIDPRQGAEHPQL